MNMIVLIPLLLAEFSSYHDRLYMLFTSYINLLYCPEWVHHPLHLKLRYLRKRRRKIGVGLEADLQGNLKKIGQKN